MKKIFKCRITLFVLVGWAVFSVVGFLRKDTVYSNYTADVKDAPYFIYVLWGLHDDIYPWNGEENASRDVLAAQKEPKNAQNDDGAAPLEASEILEATEQASPREQTASEKEKSGKNEKDKEKKEKKKKEFINVETDYFDDAVFIGDSRTVGLNYYGGLEHTDFYATKGMNIYDIWKDEFCELYGKTVTLDVALTAKQYKKVYFQIGINEMGTGTVESFMSAYAQTVEKLKTLQPDAIIYVQGIMRVTKKKSDSDPVYNNEGINARNSEIAKLADGERVFYIDVNDVVCDESGALDAELTFDNLHLYASEYSIWVDYLKTKGICMD